MPSHEEAGLHGAEGKVYVSCMSMWLECAAHVYMSVRPWLLHSLTLACVLCVHACADVVCVG